MRLRPTEANRRWWVLVAMTGSLAMVMLDQTVVAVALPSMQRDLDLTQTEVQWVVNAYILALAVLVAAAGRLGDAIGRVRSFVAGVTGFALASMACGLAQNGPEVIAARAAQGAAAAFMMTASAAIVISAFALRERGRAMAVYATIPLSLVALGPLLGGVLTEYASWRWVFFINVPVAVVALLLTRVARPRSERRPMVSPDVAGLVTLIGGVGLTVLGLQEASNWGWSSPWTIGCLAAGALLTALFVLAEHRARDPIVPLGLFRDRNFTADSLILFGTQAALIAATTFGAIFLQNIVGYSPVEAGLALLPIIAPILVVRGYVGRLFDRVGVRTPTRIGTVLCAAGLFLTAPAVAAASFPWMVPGSVVLGTGLGFVMTPTNADALSRAPDALRGAASGVVNTMRQVGGSIGLAVTGTVIATLEASRIADLVSASGGTAADEEALSGVLSELEDGRRAAVESVPAADAGVIAQVEDAVAQSIAVGYCVGGAILAGCAVVAFTLMTGGRQAAEAAAPATGHG